MKTFTRWLLALLVVAAPVMMMVHSASANTELVPAARLVAPYWDVTPGRNTLLLLTNVSEGVNLQGIGTDGAVHLEFYDKTCARADLPVHLSPTDIDQLDLKSGAHDLRGRATLPSNIGWVDIDIRRDDGARSRDSRQFNVLLGTVVISDGAGDFAIAYPMAANIGSSRYGVGGTIVERDAGGVAQFWHGKYEPYPSRLFVAAFFAEGGPINTASQLVIAGPTDGNWPGCFGAAPLPCKGEAPGQALGGATTNLIDAHVLIYDGCENFQSSDLVAHYVNNSLSGLFGTGIINQLNWKQGGRSCKNPSNFPSVDGDQENAFVGWIEIPNTINSNVGLPRGLVGVLVQSVAGTFRQGDVSRLWGDPAAGGREFEYSLVDEVDHHDLLLD
jgi:hypothetical protein